MTLFGLLSFYDEPAGALGWCIQAMAQAGIAHVVAVDGAYALYPGGQPASSLDQQGALAGACRLAGVGLTMHAPRTVWQGGEVKKRTALFQFASTIAQRDDWYWVIDADEVIETVPADLGNRLAATDMDAATVRMHDVPSGDHFSARRLYRAADITVEANHYTYIRHPDGAVLFNGGNSSREVPALDLTDVVTVEHRPGLRSTARQWAKSGYYDARNHSGVELGACERCEKPAVARVPVRWRFPNGKPPESHFAELCARHLEWADRENRRRLVTHGYNPDDFRWREKYTPLDAPVAAAAS